MLGLVLTLGSFGQNKNVKEVVPLKPLYEEFTSSTCGSCGYINVIFDSVLGNNPGTHSLIKYQMSWPGVGDPYFTEEGEVRRTYYDVWGVPDLFIDGINQAPLGMTQEIYDAYLEETTSMEIEVITSEIDENNVVTIEANLNALDNYPAGYKAHIVVVERLTVGNVGDNGEKEFYHVMMKMLPDANGTTLPAFSNGSSENLSFSFDMDDTFMETANDLSVVIFVQNDDDKSIIQSEEAPIICGLPEFNINVSVIDTYGNPVEGAEIFVENYGSLTTNAAGNTVYENILPGTYTWNIMASGLLPTNGYVVIIDDDFDLNIVMEDPGYYYYEDFTTGIPEDYTLYATDPDFLYWYEGVVIMFSQTFNMDNPLMMVSDLIDITPGEKIFFDVGEHNGVPTELAFGIVTDSEDPESFVEIDVFEPTVNWQTYEYVLADVLPDQQEVYFAWKFNSPVIAHFKIDDIKINYGQATETYNAIISVFDGSYPVEGAEVLINGITQLTNDNGTAIFSDLDNGSYNYSITAYGYLEFDGQFEITGNDELVEVNLLIDLLENVENNGINMYPNPVHDQLIINTMEPINELRIFDMAGKMIYSAMDLGNDIELNTSEFQKGVYFVKIRSNDEEITKKIIIE